MMRSTSFAFASILFATACGDNVSSPAGTAAPTCAETQCDPNATCSEATGDALCTCNAGYSGDGTTCADIDECATANACPAGVACANAPGGFDCLPASCAQVAAIDPHAADGDYTLYIGGDPAKSWKAYCATMATTPKEYLSLVNVGPDSNFGQYTSDTFSSPGVSVRTNYTKVAIDPVALTLDLGDQLFSTSTGRLMHAGSQRVDSMPLGVAMSCDGTASGLAQIDLQGTAFAIDDSWKLSGAGPIGNAVLSNNNQTVAVTGGGGCGWNGPLATPYNPFNMQSFALQLKFVP